MRIPLVDLQSQQAEIADEVQAGMAEVLAQGAFIGGADVAAFENEYAAFTGTRHCVGVANGTDALELALRAVGVVPGGEVIIPANTFVATAEAVSRIGATPVFVDVDDRYLLIDPQAVERALGPRTQAVVPVHLFGQAAPMEDLLCLTEGANVILVEDAAQSQGAQQGSRPAGSVGKAAATSFYPGKNLGAAGDAGAVMTSDDEVAHMVRLLGAHGSTTKYVHETIGFNSRLDTLQAVVLRAKLARLEKWNDLRRQAAQRYTELLSGIPDVGLPSTMPTNEHVWHLYVVRVPERDRVLAELNAAGVGAAIHYPTPVHLTPAYSHLARRTGSLPVAERAATEILSLPIHPHITAAQQEYVATVLARALRSR